MKAPIAIAIHHRPNMVDIDLELAVDCDSAATVDMHNDDLKEPGRRC